MPEYGVWIGITRRCTKPQVTNYVWYGARGISVCDRWRRSFPAFLADMGPRPSPAHQIDRIDNDGHYEPGNCRWATPKENGRNTSKTRLITIGGVTRPFAEWVELSGLSKSTIWTRLNTGWDARLAVTTTPIPRSDRYRGQPRAIEADRRRAGA